MSGLRNQNVGGLLDREPPLVPVLIGSVDVDCFAENSTTYRLSSLRPCARSLRIFASRWLRNEGVVLPIARLTVRKPGNSQALRHKSVELQMKIGYTSAHDSRGEAISVGAFGDCAASGAGDDGQYNRDG